MRTFFYSSFFLLCLATLSMQARDRSYTLQSPDKTTSLTIDAGTDIRWTLSQDEDVLIAPSGISLRLGDGRILGKDVKVKSVERDEINSSFTAINYRRKLVKDQYSKLVLHFKGDYALEFRLYNDAAAYRFITSIDEDITVMEEEANFNFPEDHMAYIPYLWDYRGGEIYNASFESEYTVERISDFAVDSLAFLPLLVDAGSGRKVVLMEADLEDYPGMFLVMNETGKGFRGHYAKVPLEWEIGGYGRLNLIPTKRAEYIARTSGKRSFPWRIAAFSREDRELLDNDIIQKLASPSRIEDPSWIVPGQVAWDWWDGYSITGVDFKAGMNTATFLYYIDFAAANGARYIILDEGWAIEKDLTRVNPDVDLEEIVSHAREKNVGVILWASWRHILEQMEEVFPVYARMGIKGWKIDFIDRDDQIAVQSTYTIARLAAKYNMMVDYHGVFKPTGLQRTWPNVVGYEGVYGLENFKWADKDAPRYAVTIPFIRNMAGPVDYTSGAMINTNQAGFVARNSSPMSKGTRCHQVAQYLVFEVPIQMLSDSPSRYMKEQETTDFITSLPTVFDESVPLAGKVGEYVAIARKKGEQWYIGAMTNWTGRSLDLDLSFLGEGSFRAEIMKDGVNADQTADDYAMEERILSGNETLKIEMAGGGGWAARITKLD